MSLYIYIYMYRSLLRASALKKGTGGDKLYRREDYRRKVARFIY